MLRGPMLCAAPPSTPDILTRPGREGPCAHSTDEQTKALTGDLGQAPCSPPQTPPTPAHPQPVLCPFYRWVS